MSTLVSSDVDMTPVIRPVLDLTDVKKNAGEIGSILSTNPISVDSTYSSARAAAAGHQSNQAALADQIAANHSETTTYNQYNNSPKALSSAEIYRQTKNQLSVAKGALK
jgi:hypothetical protein